MIMDDDDIPLSRSTPTVFDRRPFHHVKCQNKINPNQSKMIDHLLIIILSFLMVVAGEQMIEMMEPSLIDRFPHPGIAFTEGLTIDDTTGEIYESTGMWGLSSVRSLRKINSSFTDVIMQRNIDPNTFSEGITIWRRDSILQLTYKRNVLLVFDRDTLELKCEVPYPSNSFREGWGLYYDAKITDRLYVTDGSDRMYGLRFEGCDSELVTETELMVYVSLQNKVKIPIHGLNDMTLDPVKRIWWIVVNKSKCVVGVDSISGIAIRWVDLSAFGPRSTIFEKAGDMNGIAMNTVSGHFLLTGKNWPYMYEFELQEESVSSSSSASRFRELCLVHNNENNLGGDRRDTSSSSSNIISGGTNDLDGDNNTNIYEGLLSSLLYNNNV